MPGDTELDELMSRFGAGERTWELGVRLAAVLAAAGRTAQVPGILVECRPLDLAKIGAVKVAEVTEDRVGFTGWVLPKSLGGSGIVVFGKHAREVRMGDVFRHAFGGMGAAVGSVPLSWWLERSSGESVGGMGTTFDEYMEPDLNTTMLYTEVLDELKKLANAVGATVAAERSSEFE